MSDPDPVAPRRGRPPKATTQPLAADATATTPKAWPEWYTTRNAFKERLQGEDRWTPYLKRREQLKKLHTIDEANRLAAWEFPPLPEALSPSIEREEPAGGGDDEPSGASIFAPTTAADFAKKPKVSPREEIEWVGDNYSRSDVTAKEAPSGKAWNMLRFVRMHDKGMEIFWGKLFPETMPSQKSLEASNRYTDRGGVILDALELALEMRKLEKADAAQNPASPAETLPVDSAADSIDYPPPASAPSNGQNSRTW